MNPEQSFGRFVRQRRRELDLTQEELARRVGCAAITIRKIEADDARPSVQIAERLAMALAIPLDDRAEFVRRARETRPEAPLPVETPMPTLEEIGGADLSGRAVRGYALGERIGAGGMGAVYRATQPLVEREVAVKIILPAFANHPDFIRRFEAEAQLVARLEHPHIVPLYDYWREPGVAYLVMRLLRGGSIQGLLQSGPLPLETISRLLEQICTALHSAHRIGIIHRDLKPGNVLLDEDNNAYLADFGIAKNLGNPNLEDQTQLDALIGSPHYMSPEQIRSLSVRPQTDIYCLGVMLYEMLTGALPFTGPTPFDLLQQHITAPLPSLAAHRMGLPAALDAVIARAAAKEPDERYADTLSLLNDFRRALREGAAPLPIFIPAEEDDLRETVNPYKGLRAFGEADADDFFGRETLIQQLLARLSEGGELARFLAIIGPSGSGKSSVVKAGLVPTLRRGGLLGSENWFYVDLMPGPHPFEELEAALLRVAVNPPASLLAQLRDSHRGLSRAVNRILPADESVDLVLVIDQFEELFTLTTDDANAERALFLSNLVTAVMDERSRVRVIITLRADFIDRPLRYVDFGELVQRRSELVLPLTPDELERAIVGPARRAGLKLEAGLTSAMIRAVGDQPGALPLLQYALTELFEKRNGRTLTKSAYDSIGGVLGALGRRAEEVFSQLDEAGQSTARQLFLRLVTLGEGVEDTRRRVLRAELDSLVTDDGHSSRVATSHRLSSIVETFGKHRLLSFDRDPVTRGPTVEVAHEALLREWGRLREWLSESRADVRLQRQLAQAATEWQHAQHDVSFLLTGARLEQFEGWAATSVIALTQSERAFLDASRAERERVQGAETERQRREWSLQKRAAISLRYLVGALTFFLLVALGLTAIAFNRQAEAQNNFIRAEQEARIARARELAAASLLNLDVDSERSILLALQAVTETYAINNMALPEAEDALHRAVQASRIAFTLYGHTAIVWEAIYNPDGTRLATVSDDGTARLWDATTGKELLTWKAHGGGVVFSVAFSPDGKLLVTGGGDNTARVWDVATGQQLLTLRGHLDSVYHAIFSPDGKHLATASPDGLVKIWDATTGDELHSLREDGEAVVINRIVFSPDGARLALAGEEGETGRASIWDTVTGQKLITLAGHTIQVRGIVFSPDGTRLATAIADRTIKIWDASNGKELLTLYGHTDVLSGVAFSPDGTRLASSSWDRQVKIWEVATGRELFALVGHSASVWSVAFSPDGVRLVTASADNTVKVWNMTPSQELLTVVNKPAQPSPAPAIVAYSPDGIHLAAANLNPTPEVWDIATGRLLFTLAGHTGIVRGLAYSQDGTRIATASDDQTAKIWDAQTGREIFTFSDAHSDLVISVAFSPAGTRLATASFDGTAKVWDVTTGQQLLTLPGHAAQVVHVTFSPDGTRLVTASFDSTAKVWDATTGRELLVLSGHLDSIRQVNFSSDGTRVVTASFDGTAKVWDAATGKELMTISGHSGFVYSAAFSPDDAMIATASTDGTARLWDAVTGDEVLTLYGDGGGVTNVAFSPDGSRLATANRDNTSRLYLLRIDDLVALAHSRLTRALTTEECQQYLHMEMCPQP